MMQNTNGHFYLWIFFAICSLGLYAQPESKWIRPRPEWTAAYRSPDNTHYWKHRKPYPSYWQQDVKYRIQATLDDDAQALRASLMLLTYYNNSPDTLHEMYFHVYENAFQPHSYYHQLWLANKQKPNFGKKYEIKGLGTTVHEMLYNGSPVTPEHDNTIFRIRLPSPLLPGDSAVIQCSFDTYFDSGDMRRRNKIFENSRRTHHYDAVHWYPSVCVYDRKFGWHTDQHLDKEFYSEIGSFEVALTVPSHFIVEATGILTNKKEVMPDTLEQQLNINNFISKPWNSVPSDIIAPTNSKKTWKYYANNVHNFAFTTDPTYRIGKDTTRQGIEVISLVQETHAIGWKSSGRFTAKVMEVYEKDFGPYIWPKVVIADARDGMEYPMLTLDDGYYPRHQFLLAHEVGHMWYYGMVSSNETYRALLDEGFTQFLTIWSMEKIVGKGAKNVYALPVYKSDSVKYRMERMYDGYLKDVLAGYDEPLNTHSSGFHSAIRQGGGYRMVYFKTATMLYNLRYVLGDSLFQGAMRYYFQKWYNAHPYPEDFREAVREYTKWDLTWFFDQWLETTKNVDYAISRIRKRSSVSNLARVVYDTTFAHDTPYLYEIFLKRKGRMHMPLDIQVLYSNDSISTWHIPNTWHTKPQDAQLLPKWYGWDRLNQQYSMAVYTPYKIKKLHIDPKGDLADIDLRNNTSGMFYKWRLDYGLETKQPRDKQFLYARPDAWWNAFDGVQTGVNLKTNYYDSQDWWECSVYQHSGLAQYQIPQEIKNKHQWGSYFVTYRRHMLGIWRQLYFQSDQMYSGGVWKQKSGFEKIFRYQDLKNPRYTTLFLYTQQLLRPHSIYDEYSLYSDHWEVNRLNSVIQMGVRRNYPLGNKQGHWQTELRVPGPLAGTNYGYLQFSSINIINLLKVFELRSRTFARAGYGDTPMESQLYLAGASPEELIHNKYTRSRGFVPPTWTDYNEFEYTPFHMGGGLNIRGYSGYKDIYAYIPGDTTYQNYIGRSGIAHSLEVDLDGLVPRFDHRLLRPFHLDTYIFADAGYMFSIQTQANKQFPGPFRGSTGVGTALTIQFRGFDIKPLTLRVDYPLLNSSDTFESNAFDPRRILFGINRSF